MRITTGEPGKMQPNHMAPPFRTAKYGGWWIGVPQNLLRIATMRANQPKLFEG